MNLEKYDFDIIEVNALKRSGHHAFMKWLSVNLYGVEPQFGYKLEFVSNSGLWVWNDVTKYEKLGNELINSSLRINQPKTLMLNYEDENINYTYFNEDKKYKGPKNYINLSKKSNVKRVYIIRDFYNCLTSRLSHENKNQHTGDFGLRYIKLWKDYAKNYLISKNQTIKFEDLITSDEKCEKFLNFNFNVSNIYPFNGVGKTKSSFKDDKNYLNRFNPNIIPEETKNLIRKDNELHYLIGTLEYEYKEI